MASLDVGVAVFDAGGPEVDVVMLETVDEISAIIVRVPSDEASFSTPILTSNLTSVPSDDQESPNLSTSPRDEIWRYDLKERRN